MPKVLAEQLGQAEDLRTKESEHFLNVVNSVSETKKKTKVKGLVEELDNIQRREELQKANFSKQRSRFEEALRSYSKLKQGSLTVEEKTHIIGSSIRDVFSEIEEEEEDDDDSVRRVGFMKEFFYAINPIDRDEWQEMKVISKMFACFQAPFFVLLKLVIPVMDPTAANSAWCKPLYMVNCITMPLYSVTALRVAMIEVMPGVPYLLIAALISVTLCLFVALTSKRHPPPSYHTAFALMGFVSSIITVYVVVNEVVGVLNAIGFVFSVSDATIGITIMALGNSIGDLVTTLSLASAGLPRMAFAGCYGGPLLSCDGGVLRKRLPVFAGRTHLLRGDVACDGL
ncbi:hypothetical protein C0J52_18744 [Blattella germanica]|nr:hypothetical protein C0J52_18744 [Blattella germanica]